MANTEFSNANVKLLAKLLLACVYGMSNADEDVHVTQPFGKEVCSAVELYPERGALAAAIEEIWMDGMSYDSFDRRVIRDGLPAFVEQYGTTLQVNDAILEPITSYRLDWE